jgi:hypothetical protein
MIKSDGHLCTSDISNASLLIVPEVPDFSSADFSVSVDQHQSR